jgi:hypothetical protein
MAAHSTLARTCIAQMAKCGEARPSAAWGRRRTSRNFVNRKSLGPLWLQHQKMMCAASSHTHSSVQAHISLALSAFHPS